MRIGIDARLYYESGVGRYIKNTLEQLDERCRTEKIDHKFFIFLSSKGFQQIHFNSNNLIKVEADISWHSLQEQFLFAKLLNSYNLDLMHFTYFSLPIFYRKKFVVTIHDLIINHVNTGKATTLPKPLYYLKRFVYHKVIRYAVKNSIYIISPSDATRDEVVSYYKIKKEKIIVIPEGVDPEVKKIKKPQIKIPMPYILYVGNAYPHKNLNRLVESYVSIENTIKQELLLVGRSDYFYKRLHNKIRNHKKIHILHGISDNELAYLYKKADFLIAPSLMEGFGLTPLEAMGNGCLPVVSRIDAFYQVCRNAALYFNPKDIQDISLVLSNAANLSTQEKSKYKKRFRDRLELFSWKKSIERTLSVYERCNSI